MRIAPDAEDHRHRDGRASGGGKGELMTSFDYDVVIIHSGFGGSAAALRRREGLPREAME